LSLRARKKQQARNDILSAAEKLIKQRGYSDTTMKDIAEVANMSYQTLYNYFPTKSTIVQCLLLKDVTAAAVKAEALISNYESDPIRLIYSGAKIQLDMVSTRDRHLWREFVAEYMINSQDMPEAVEHTDLGAHARIERALKVTQKAGHLKTGVDVVVMTNIIYNTTEMAFLAYIMRPALSRANMLRAFEKELSLIITPYLASQDDKNC
jgi:AcrR family transcriptional regulator